MLEGPEKEDTVLVDWGPHRIRRYCKEDNSRSENWKKS